MIRFSPREEYLDAATQSLLNRGARLTEVLKQPQYSPLPIEQQILVLYAAVKGFCDRMPLEQLPNYERTICSRIDPELLQAILATGELTHEIARKLDAFLNSVGME